MAGKIIIALLHNTASKKIDPLAFFLKIVGNEIGHKVHRTVYCYIVTKNTRIFFQIHHS